MSEWIHTITESYRQLIDGFSYPGDVFDLKSDIENPYPALLDKRVLVISKMLLDREVTFAVMDPKKDEITEIIRALTSSRVSEASQADYIFVTLKTLDTKGLKDLMSSVKQGSLLDPHQTGTLIFSVDSLQEGDDYIFSGPGILQEKKVSITGMKKVFAIRQGILKEFPMGLDMILISNANHIMALPRTTRIKEV